MVSFWVWDSVWLKSPRRLQQPPQNPSLRASCCRPAGAGGGGEAPPPPGRRWANSPGQGVGSGDGSRYPSRHSPASQTPAPGPERGSPGAPPCRSLGRPRLSRSQNGRWGAGPPLRRSPGRGTAPPPGSGHHRLRGEEAGAGQRGAEPRRGAEGREKRGKAGGRPPPPPLPALTISRKMTAPE